MLGHSPAYVSPLLLLAFSKLQLFNYLLNLGLNFLRYACGPPRLGHHHFALLIAFYCFLMCIKYLLKFPFFFHFPPVAFDQINPELRPLPVLLFLARQDVAYQDPADWVLALVLLAEQIFDFVLSAYTLGFFNKPLMV